MSEPILVWGVGAIGGCLGAALVRAGEEVVFVDRDAAHVAAINERGLTITGEIDPHSVRARALLPEAVEGRSRRIILAVKAHHTREATLALLPHLQHNGFVVSAQNGLNERVIAGIVGADRTVGAFVNFGADYIEPGVVLYGGRGAVVVGELDGATTPRIEDVHRLFRLFDTRAVLTGNIWGYLWSKLVYGAMLFATAVTNDSIADVLAMERYRPMLTSLAREVLAVAAAEKIKLESFDGFDPAAFSLLASPETTGRSYDDMVAHNRRSAKSHSGIWRDLAIRKRKTEVDEQIGPIAEIGRRHGIPTPLIDALIGLIHATEEGRRPLELAGLDTLRQAAEGAVTGEPGR